MRDNTNKEETRQALKELFEKQENKDTFFGYLEAINYQFDLSRYPYTIIRHLNPDFCKEIKEHKQTKTGKGVRVRMSCLVNSGSYLQRKRLGIIMY